jgi:pimeloyl-ACP methyl ester carboxylesterase
VPHSLPPQIANLTEATSIGLAQRIQFAPITPDFHPDPIATPYIRPSPDLDRLDATPILLLHGFDSSLLEFRRLLPLLEAKKQPTWAIDLLGFGFSERPALAYSPATIKAHLYQFWKTQINRPIVFLGASMGGAAAIDFALTYPDIVERLVLIDSAGIPNGPILGKFIGPPIDSWAVAFLKRPDVRRSISRNAYANPDRLVTDDACLCAALHLQTPGWPDALKSFTKSGGYPSFKPRLAELPQPTLILWGRQDKILGTRDPAQFMAKLPNPELVWIEEAGHVPHLEQPELVTDTIATFLAPEPTP